MKQITLAFLMVFFSNTILMAQKQITTWHKNQVIAHRGAWKKQNLPENSIASLKHAFKLNCYGSEFDVHLTADGVVVVNHDATFLGMNIAKSTYQQLLAKKLSNGESIPTLEEFIKTGLKQKKTKLILEIKPQNLGKERDQILTEKSLQLVRKYKAQPWIEYISFGYDICTYIIKNEPNAKVAYLTGNVAPEKMKADGFTGVDYHFSVYQQNPDYIERFNHASAGEFRGMKGDAYEGGHRIPFFVRWPAEVKANTVSNATTSLANLLATCGDLTGIKATSEDTYSIMPILKGQTKEIKGQPGIVVSSSIGYLSIRKGDWKLIEGLGSGGFTEPQKIEQVKEGVNGQLFNLKSNYSNK